MDRVVQSLPEAGLENTALKNAAATYLKFALGCVDGLRTTDGDFEGPMLGIPPDYEVLEAAGIDLNDWVFEKCVWEPRVFRDPRLGHRRVRDAFDLEEELLFSMHGVLRAGLWQSTYHLTDKALYVFGESHEDSCARLPLELFISQTKNPRGATGPGNYQMVFVNPMEFDFGVLPEHALTGVLKGEGEKPDTPVVAVNGFQVVDAAGWDAFGHALARAVAKALPTERFEVETAGHKVGCLISKTITGEGTFCFEDALLDPNVARKIRDTEEFKASVRRALASLPLPTAPPDVSALRSETVAPPADDMSGDPSDDLRDRLDRLSRLRDDGVIDEDEYTNQRQRILDEI